ncbi:hypothetical protein Tco_0509394 [Tanacetum coccineum]
MDNHKKTSGVFRNKLDENGIVSRNRLALVAQGYNQQEGIDYDETYAQLLDLSQLGEMTLEEELRSTHEGRPVSSESTKYDNSQIMFQIIKLLKLPSHTKGENDDMETQETKVEKELEKETTEEVPTRPTRAVPISIVTEEPTMKLVPASREVCQDPDEPIKVPYEIHGKIYQLTNDEIQAHMDKKRKSRKLLRKQSYWL